MMPDYMEALVSQVGVQRILTDLHSVVNDQYCEVMNEKDPKKWTYLYLLKLDLEIALQRYKQRHMLEDDDD